MRRSGRTAVALVSVAVLGSGRARAQSRVAPYDPWPVRGARGTGSELNRHLCGAERVEVMPVAGVPGEVAAVTYGHVGEQATVSLRILSADGATSARVELPDHERVLAAARPRIRDAAPLRVVARKRDGALSVLEMDVLGRAREITTVGGIVAIQIRDGGERLLVATDAVRRLRQDGTVVWRASLRHGRDGAFFGGLSGPIFFATASEIEIVDETGTVRLKRAPRGASFVAFAHDDDGGRQRLVVVDSLTNVYLLDGAANMHRLGLVRRAAQPALVTGVSLVVRGAMAVVGVADALAAVNLAAGRIERRYDPAVVAEGPIDRVEILDARRVAGSPLPRFVVGIRRRAQPTTIVALLEGEGTAPRWRREAVEPRAWLTPQGVSVVTQLVGGTIRVSLEGRTQPALPWLPGAPFAIAESGNIAWLSAGAHLLRFEASGELGGVTLPGACTPDPPAADVLLRAVEAATAVTGRSERTGAALLAAVNQLMLRGSAGQRARAAWGFVRAWNAYRTTTFGRATFPPDVGYYWIVAGALEQASRDAASAGDSVLAARASEGRELADAFARLAMQGPSGGARGAVDDVAAFVRAHPRSPLVEFARLRALILAARAAGRDGLAEMREWLDRAVAANPATPAALQLVLYARAGWDVVAIATPAPGDPANGAARLRRIVEAVERREPPARALGRERLSALGAWGLAIGLARRPDGWRALREALAPARDRFDPDGLVFLWQPEPPPR